MKSIVLEVAEKKKKDILIQFSSYVFLFNTSG